MREQKADIRDEEFAFLEKEILSLRNKERAKSRTYKTIIEGIIKGIDSKISEKVFRLIRKYFNMVGIGNPMSLEEFVW